MLTLDKVSRMAGENKSLKIDIVTFRSHFDLTSIGFSVLYLLLKRAPLLKEGACFFEEASNSRQFLHCWATLRPLKVSHG